jgi:hypothetical protein
MKRILVFLAILAFWVNSMRQLVIREVVPAVRAATIAAQGVRYSEIRQKLPTWRRIRMGIYTERRAGGQPETRRVGTLMRRIIPQGPQDLEVTTTLHVDLGSLLPLGPIGTGPVSALMRTVISRGKLASMEMRMRRSETERPWVEVNGRVAGDKLNLVLRVGGETRRQVLPFDPQYLLDGDLSPMTGLPDLYLGKRWTIRTLQILDGQIRSVQARVTGKETLLWQGLETECYVVEIGEGAVRATAWVDLTGQILKYKTMALVFLLEPVPSGNEDDRDRIPDEEVRREDSR